MFAYCSNDPTIRSDRYGKSSFIEGWNDFWKDIKEWLEKKKEENADNADVTVTVGGTASGGFGVSGSVSKGITFDTKGNIGISETWSIGGGFPSCSAGGFISVNNAPDIHKQSGMGFVTGVSGGEGVGVGGEYNMLIDKDNDCVYHGGTFSVAVGLYPTVVEVHGEYSETEVFGFNIFDAAIAAVEWLIGE